jgi:tetratricopeptide (TPR) repeat protein
MVLSQKISSEAFLTNRFGDRYLYTINRSVFNHSGSRSIYHGRLQTLLKKENFLYIVIGTDSGLLLEYIKSKIIPEGSRVICIELPEILLRLRDERAMQDLDERITCISLAEFAQAEADPSFKMTEYFMLGNVEQLMSLAACDAFTAEYRELAWNVQQMLGQKDWTIASTLGNELFIETQLMNVAENRFSGSCFRNIFNGKTAVLLGGGPSLDEFLPWLQNNRGKVVVLAVSRISNRLLEVGLPPDFVFSVDPQKISFEVSKEMLQFNRGTVFVNGFHTSPHLLSQWHGAGCYSGALFPWETTLNIAADFPHPGPTVTNTALAAAVEMGFSQIILAGVDLCFDSAGNSHAKGSCERAAGPQFSEQQYWVRTNNGDDAVTTHAMGRAVSIFGMQAGLALEKGCKIFNSVLGAAEIPNVEYSPPEDIQIEPSGADIRKIIWEALPEDTAESRTTHYKAVIAELSRAQTKFKQIKNLAEDALKYNDGLFGRNGMKADFKYKIKMDKVEKKLNRSYAEFMPLIKKFGVRNFLKMTQIKEAAKWTDEEIEKTGRIYYESCRDSAERLLDLVDDALERTSSRLEEEQISPDLASIFSQWCKDEVPGRAPIWKTRNPQWENRLDEKDKEKLATLEKKFTSIITQKKIPYAERTVKNADPAVARGNALLLFQNHNTNGLMQLITGLSLMGNQDAERVAHLVKGYLAELNNDQETAVNEYHEVITEAVDPVLEDALCRISLLALKRPDFEQAQAALECLSSISPAYLSQYADFLKLTGNVRQAVDLYADYLEQVPDDINAMLKLGEIYKEQGLKDGAEMLFEAVLKINPKNSAAEFFLAELKKD